MKHKFILSFLVLFFVALVLLFLRAGRTELNRVFIPSEFVNFIKTVEGQDFLSQSYRKIRIAGQVADAEIKYQVEPEIKLEFYIQDRKKASNVKQKSVPVVSVVYQGIKPDMFAVSRDVIMDGYYQGDRFVATELKTQCPSKYEPPSPAS